MKFKLTTNRNKQDSSNLWMFKSLLSTWKVYEQIDILHIYLYNLVSSTYKTDCHDITEILLNVALNTITPYPPQKNADINGGVG
jgi:hypothetical protein